MEDSSNKATDTPWYDKDTSLSDEEKLAIMNLISSAVVGLTPEDKANIERDIRVVSDRIAEKEIFR
jgi:hypothetical protein